MQGWFLGKRLRCSKSLNVLHDVQAIVLWDSHRANHEEEALTLGKVMVIVGITCRFVRTGLKST
jgi:hypothetical protein